jgi:acyl-coenzyme A synthetase/AMP-(fatty) acid ligase
MKQLDLGSLRLIAVAGAPLDFALKSRVEAEFALPFSNGYGITECSPGISGVRFDAPRADNAVGTLLPGVEAHQDARRPTSRQRRNRRAARARAKCHARLANRTSYDE